MARTSEFTLTLDSMKELLSSDPEDVLQRLNSIQNHKKSSIEHFVEKNLFKEREVDAVVQLLAKAFSSQNQGGVVKLYNSILINGQQFFENDIISSIQKIHFGDHNIKLQRLLEDYTSIMIVMLKICPKESAVPLVDKIHPKLSAIINLMRGMNIDVHSVIRNLQQLEGSCANYKVLLDRNKGNPIRSFRNIPIFPEHVDFDESYTPLLRPNIIDGPYLDVEDYLDVHYRLMREDMVESFRKIIDSKQKNDRGAIIRNVAVEYPPKYTVNGVAHKISFQLPKPIDWGKNKRFLQGSLLCLSGDFFKKSLLFGTVFVRAPDSGMSNKCELELVVEQDVNVEIKTKDNYSLIETTAYFESYRHVLKALLRYDAGNFPLEDYIVHLDVDNHKPQYFQDIKFCLHENCELTEDSIDHDCCSKEFDVHKEEEWPSVENLKLDVYQHKAFQAALTERLALVQGPPGTGKTYLGVKIVKAILDNCNKKPIVISCMTNHALDQFLERLMKYTKKIVRLGDQTQLDIVKPHSKSSLLSAIRTARNEGADNITDPKIKISLDIAKQLVPNILINDHQTFNPDYLSLRNSAANLNSLIERFQFCVHFCMNYKALNEILADSFKQVLCFNNTNKASDLNAYMLKWLNVNSDSDVYKSNGFQVLPNLDYICEDKEVSLKTAEEIWGKPVDQRLKLFYKMRRNCLKNLKNCITSEKNKYYKFLQLKEVYLDPDTCSLLQSADIIGVTMTGSAKYFDTLNYIKPEIMIIEEAAEALEAHLITSLLPSIKKLILIGDHEQLRPIPANHEYSVNYNMNISLFERLIKNKIPSARLVTQFRMRPCIANLLVPDIYETLDSHKSVSEYEHIKGTSHDLYFIKHHTEEDECSVTNTSVSNTFEAQFILKLTMYLLKQGYSPPQITILAMYSEQVRLLQKLTVAEKLTSDILVTTVDNYQGEENDIVLISFVRSNDNDYIGFLKESNRVCVALSRARKGLYCIGNFDMLARKSSLFSSIVAKLQNVGLEQDELKQIGFGFPLECAMHKRKIQLRDNQDFESFLLKGCEGPCNYLLTCGHNCAKICHFDDLEHELYRCRQPCIKHITNPVTNLLMVCNRLCYQSCQTKKKKVRLPCGHKVSINYGEDIPIECSEFREKLVSCGHLIKVPCSGYHRATLCAALVPVILNCNHEKFVQCSSKSNLSKTPCYEPVPYDSPCGHIVELPCLESPEDSTLLSACQRPCDSLLSCGHACVGMCRWCYTVRIHPMCQVKCDKFLPCGHKCTGKCGAPCITCKEICFVKCSHRHCINPCSKPCIECEVSCARVCKHQRCSLKCKDMCDVEPCDFPCEIVLQCGHKCIGLCSDPCPIWCRVCQLDQLKSEHPETDLFVLLEDCNHIVEVVELTFHINQQIECLVWPSCPTCNVPIRKSERYRCQLKVMKDIMIGNLDVSNYISNIQYLFHTMFGLDNIAPWRFQESQRRIKFALYEKIPTEGAMILLRSCIGALIRLLAIDTKLKHLENIEVQNQLECFITWVNNHLHLASYQQLDELDIAITRLESLFHMPALDYSI